MRHGPYTTPHFVHTHTRHTHLNRYRCPCAPVCSVLCRAQVQAYRGQPGATGLSSVLFPLLGSLAIWMGRTAELALFSPREAARRSSSAELGVMLQIAMLWGGAIVLLQVDASTPEGNLQYSDRAADLLWTGNLWWFVRNAQRPLMRLWLPGSHLPIEQSAVCQNIGFVTHRNNEFMVTAPPAPPPAHTHASAPF